MTARLARRHYPIIEVAELTGASVEDILELAATRKIELCLDGTSPADRKKRFMKKVAPADAELTLLALPKFKKKENVLIRSESDIDSYGGFYVWSVYDIVVAAGKDSGVRETHVKFRVRDLWLPKESVLTIKGLFSERHSSEDDSFDFRYWSLDGREVSARTERQAMMLAFLWKHAKSRKGFHESEIIDAAAVKRNKGSTLKSYFNNGKDEAWSLLEKSGRATYRLVSSAKPLRPI